MEYESRGDKYINLWLEEYLNIIRPYLRDMIDNHKAYGEYKIQLIIKIYFISSLGTSEIREMYTESDNMKIMSGIEADDIIKELFNSCLKRYQENVETKMRASSFVLEGIKLLSYRLHKISLNRGGSYIDSPDWIKNKKATINRKKNGDNGWFKYAKAVALNYEKIGRDPQRISKIIPFLNKYNWKDVEFLPNPKDWKKFEQNNEKNCS